MSERERKQIRFEVQTASPGHEARAIRGEQSNTIRVVCKYFTSLKAIISSASFYAEKTAYFSF